MKPMLHGTGSKSRFFYYGFFVDLFVSGGGSATGFFSFLISSAEQKVCQSGVQNCCRRFIECSGKPVAVRIVMQMLACS